MKNKPIFEVFAIRGATTAESNTKEAISHASKALFERIVEKNDLLSEDYDIVSIQISTTEDLTAFYPAAAIREIVSDVPLFSAKEPSMQNGLPLCIRLLVTISSRKEQKAQKKHIYLNKAGALRPDLVQEDG